MRYDIYGSHPFLGTLIEADVIPTPRLVDEGTRGPVEAYKEIEAGETSAGKSVWRVRDDKYDPPGTEYRWVRVWTRE